MLFTFIHKDWIAAYVIGLIAALAVVAFFVASFLGHPSPIAMARAVVSATPHDPSVASDMAAASRSADAINAGVESAYHARLIDSMGVDAGGHTLIVYIERKTWRRLKQPQQDAIRKGLLSAFSGAYWQSHATAGSAAPPPVLVLQSMASR